jgi:hypothetical protein
MTAEKKGCAHWQGVADRSAIPYVGQCIEASLVMQQQTIEMKCWLTEFYELSIIGSLLLFIDSIVMCRQITTTSRISLEPEFVAAQQLQFHHAHSWMLEDTSICNHICTFLSVTRRCASTVDGQGVD